MPEEYPATILFLIRHGQARASDGSYGPDTPLSEQGRAQAEKVADAWVGKSPPDVVYTSPYPRAVETSAPLCQRLGLEAIVDPRLAEFEMDTQPLAEAQERPDLVLWHSEHRGVEGGETLQEFGVRVGAFCEEVAERHGEQRVALFAHAGTIDAALRWLLGIPPASPWQHEFDLGNASITEAHYWLRGRVPGGAPRFAFLRCLADTAHLGDLASDL